MNLKLALCQSLDYFRANVSSDILGLKGQNNVCTFPFNFLDKTYHAIINDTKRFLKAYHEDGTYTLIDAKYSIIDKYPVTINAININAGNIKSYCIGEYNEYQMTEAVQRISRYNNETVINAHFDDIAYSENENGYLYAFDIKDLIDAKRVSFNGNFVYIEDFNGRMTFMFSKLEDNILYTNVLYNTGNRINRALRFLNDHKRHQADIKYTNEKHEFIQKLTQFLDKVPPSKFSELKDATKEFGLL